MPTVEKNGVKLNYNDTGGDGAPVLLVHGFPFNSKMWDPQVEALGERYRLIVPDLKGFGASDAPEDRSTYSVDNYADELKAVLDDAGVEQAVVVGLSMGGYVAFAFARRFPEALAGLVLAGTRAEADPPEGLEKRTNQQKQVAAEGPAGLIDAFPGALLSEKTRTERSEVVEQLKAVMDNPPAGFIGGLESMKQRPDSTSGLGNIDVPTLVIVGSDDPLIPPSASESMHQAIGGSEMVTIPGAGHVANLESPEEFTRALDGFLAKL